MPKKSVCYRPDPPSHPTPSPTLPHPAKQPHHSPTSHLRPTPPPQTPQEFDFELLRTGITRIEDTKDDIPEEEMSDAFLTPAASWVQRMGVGLSVLLIIVWPVSVLVWGVFDKSLYTIWASVVFVWGYVAAVVIIILPVYESSDIFIQILCCTVTKTENQVKVEVASA